MPLWGMVRSRSMIVSLVFLSGCSGEERPDLIPSNEAIARVETALGNHPCVGPLNEWERHYRFQTHRTTFTHLIGNTNFGAIEFQLRRAGTLSKPGLVVHAVNPPHPPHPFPLTAPRERILSGEFTLSAGQLSLKGC